MCCTTQFVVSLVCGHWNCWSLLEAHTRAHARSWASLPRGNATNLQKRLKIPMPSLVWCCIRVWSRCLVAFVAAFLWSRPAFRGGSEETMLLQQLLVLSFPADLIGFLRERVGKPSVVRLGFCPFAFSLSLGNSFCRRFSIFVGIRLRIFVFLASLEMMLWCGLLGWTTFSVAKLPHLLSRRLCGRKLRSYVHEAIARPSLRKKNSRRGRVVNR